MNVPWTFGKECGPCYRWLGFCKCQVDSWVLFRSFISLTVFLVCFLILTRWVRNLYIWLWIFFCFLFHFGHIWNSVTWIHIVISYWLIDSLVLENIPCFEAHFVLFYYKDLKFCVVYLFIYIFTLYIYTHITLYLWICFIVNFFNPISWFLHFTWSVLGHLFNKIISILDFKSNICKLLCLPHAVLCSCFPLFLPTFTL